METTVEGFCNAMARCQFLPEERIRDLRQRWRQGAATDPGGMEQFTQWLIAKHAATEYQVSVLSRGNGEQLFLGPYRILERIGRGRMAGVFKATHPSGVLVAIKVLPPSKAAQPLVLARFQREVKLALSVKHPNIVASYHAAEHKGLNYLAMEYLEGETLEDVLLRQKRLPAAEAVAVVYQAFLGLQAIYELGLVHRDLKPGNLMLVGGQPSSTTGASVKILDLGTGRALFDEEEGGPGFDLTRPGEMLGSSDYMSPEQAKDAHNIDIRSDIYALGCVLYHTLAGESPFADASPVRQLLRHATEEPQPITRRNPQVPSGLEQILGWMLAKDPAKRYPTPARAAQALKVFLAANSDFSPPSNPRLDAYLQWLGAQGEGQSVSSPPPSQPAAPVQPPRPAAKEEVINVEIVSGPVAASPPSPRSRPQAGRDEEDERVRGDRRGGREEEEPPRSRKADREEETEVRSGFLGMSSREILILILGLGLVGLAGLGVLGLIVYRLFR